MPFRIFVVVVAVVVIALFVSFKKKIMFCLQSVRLTYVYVSSPGIIIV